MQTQQIFQAGNSSVIAIPKHLLRDLNLKAGQKVVVDKTDDGEALIVRKAIRPLKRAKKSVVDKEFKKWLDTFMKENGEILDELALR